jgi:hypothetical protein
MLQLKIQTLRRYNVFCAQIYPLQLSVISYRNQAENCVLYFHYSGYWPNKWKNGSILQQPSVFWELNYRRLQEVHQLWHYWKHVRAVEIWNHKTIKICHTAQEYQNYVNTEHYNIFHCVPWRCLYILRISLSPVWFVFFYLMCDCVLGITFVNYT